MALSKKRGAKARREFTKKLHTAAETVAFNLEERKAGRPGRYHSGFCHLAEHSGLTMNHQLGEMFGVSHDQIEDWMKAHPPFNVAIKRAKAKADDEVEDALRRRALGYSHPDTHISVSQRTAAGGGSEPVVVQTPVIKHYPPSETAGIFWLKNRRPDRWRPDTSLIPARDPEDAAAQLRAQLAAIEDTTTKKGAKE